MSFYPPLVPNLVFSPWTHTCYIFSSKTHTFLLPSGPPREALAAELDSERLRLTQLQSLYASFTTALLQKTALLQSESGILLQMREVREKIAEKVILAQVGGFNRCVSHR
jgi:hypothetical protein